jgi:hypothetical protein
MIDSGHVFQQTEEPLREVVRFQSVIVELLACVSGAKNINEKEMREAKKMVIIAQGILFAIK